MIGDNLILDVEVPKFLGLHTIHVTNGRPALRENEIEYASKINSDYILKLM